MKSYKTVVNSYKAIINSYMRVVKTSALLLTLALTFSFGSPSAGALSNATNEQSAGAGAFWLQNQVSDSGAVSGFSGPDVSATASTAIALASVGVKNQTFNKLIDWLADNTSQYLTKPGPLSLVILAVEAGGHDANSFEGHDLVAALNATEGLWALANSKPEASGLFGESDPTYDGVYRQSLALLAISAAGQIPSTTSLAWLQTQTCGQESPASTRGGFVSFRPTQLSPCAESGFDLVPDSNSTALAIQALAAVGQNFASSLNWIRSLQNSDGGFGYSSGSESETNSTALAIQALIVGGVNVDSMSPSPLRKLSDWQLGCESKVEDQGAFEYPLFGMGGAPNMLATQQAIPALAKQSLPLPEDIAPGTLDGIVCAMPTSSLGSSTSSFPTTSTISPSQVDTSAPATSTTVTTVAGQNSSVTTTTASSNVLGVIVGQASGVGVLAATGGVFGGLINLGLVLATIGALALTALKLLRRRG